MEYSILFLGILQIKLCCRFHKRISSFLQKGFIRLIQIVIPEQKSNVGGRCQCSGISQHSSGKIMHLTDQDTSRCTSFCRKFRSLRKDIPVSLKIPFHHFRAVHSIRCAVVNHMSVPVMRISPLPDIPVPGEGASVKGHGIIRTATACHHIFLDHIQVFHIVPGCILLLHHHSGIIPE